MSSATTCSGASPTGQQLSYDAEGRLTSWQNAPGNPPTAAVNYLYDGSGNRVAMQTTTTGVVNNTGLTTYIGSIEEVQVSSGTTGATTTTYYAVGSKRVAANVNGTFYYFGYDALGSQVTVFNNSGNLIGSQLYGPYGSQRYSNGTLPTTIGFTGQQTDSVTGLDYYNARYYDPAVGQFLSADTVQGNAQGANPYSYVGGNPETRTDPTGNRFIGGNGDQGWIDSSSHAIYAQTPHSRPNSVGHAPVIHKSASSVTGGGGSGHGHMGAGSPANPAQPSDSCDSACQQREISAYNDADGARAAFQNFANTFSSWKEIIAGIIGTLIGFLAGPILGGIIDGFAAGFAILDHIAQLTANDFQKETDEVDLEPSAYQKDYGEKKQGWGYFLSDNVNIQGNKILSDLGTNGKIGVTIGIATIVASIAFGAAVSLVQTELAPVIVGLVVGGATMGVVTAIVAGAGSRAMYDKANNVINKEEQDCLC